MAGPGGVWRGKARERRGGWQAPGFKPPAPALGEAWPGEAGQGVSWHSMAWRGRARRGTARRGRESMTTTRKGVHEPI